MTFAELQVGCTLKKKRDPFEKLHT